MDTTIYDIILFVSSTSKVCAPVVYFIRENGLPIRLVRLDTQEDRESASRGNKAFQIHTVPTLLLTYSSGDIGLYVGQEKILKLLQNLLNTKIQQNQSNQEYLHSNEPRKETLIVSEDEEEFIKPKKKLKKNKEKSQKGKERSLKSKKKNIYDGRKAKKNPVIFEDDDDLLCDDVEIEYLDQETSKDDSPVKNTITKPQSLSTSGLMVGNQTMGKKNSQMNSLYEQAKQMAQDRESTLGYKESDLPVSS